MALSWAVTQVPAVRQYCHRRRGLGEWTAARHLFHMLDYERQIALPVMQQWLGAPEFLVNWDEEAGLACQLRRRHRQICSTSSAPYAARRLACCPRSPSSAWHAQQMTGWGPIPLLWLVSKTYQHTNEHTSDVLRLALFWDYYAREEQVSPGEGEG